LSFNSSIVIEVDDLWWEYQTDKRDRHC
jgi:hypothetical protein